MVITSALVGGLVAGLAVAVPLGPIGVLLVKEGVRLGPRHAWPAAAGVATVDTLYCLVAAALGAVAAPLVGGLGTWPGIVGGTALLGISAAGLWREVRTGRVPDGERAVTPAVRAAPGTSDPRALPRYLGFVGLTMVNPATLVYFAALMAGRPDLFGTAATAATFVAAVGLASFAWQLLLVYAGGFLHRRGGPGLRRATVVVGSSVVGVFGAGILIDALT